VGASQQCSEAGGYSPFVTDATRTLATTPGETGLFFDFDGTLADIVPRPEDARPLEGVPETLAALDEVFRVVCVVSGRSAEQLADWLGPRVEIWGLHGAQRAYGGRVTVAPDAARFEDLMRRVRDEARARVEDLAVPGVLVEDKRVMVGLHWRMAKDRTRAEARVREVAEDLVEKHGLAMAGGKMALELRPPIEVSKKDVVIRRAREENLRAVAFAGDDVVDLPAFDALDELSRSGVSVVKVAVVSDEAPQELTRRADVTVERPVGMRGWLQRLLALSEGVAGSSPD
jgi:trehalose 6-phosphate phosphatase